MNALTPFESNIDPAWSAAQEGVNAWRGRCLHAYGQVEFAVSETLAACAEDPKRGSAITLPHLFGQRLERLATLIGVTGAFAAEGAPAVAALTTFRQHEAQRVPLAHGNGKITLDRRGQWTLVLRMIAFRSGRAERSAVVWEQGEAATFCTALIADAQRLCAKLAHFRRAMAPSSAGSDQTAPISPAISKPTSSDAATKVASSSCA